MIVLTRIFHFEMAHAIAGYAGACGYVHGHSYELHVSLASSCADDDFIPSPGFKMDFKEIKKTVTEQVINLLDHKLVVSKAFLAENPGLQAQDNLVCWAAEPTAENLLIYIRRALENHFPKNITVARLKLYETKASYAEWIRQGFG